MVRDERFGKSTKDGSELAAEWMEGITTNWSKAGKQKKKKKVIIFFFFKNDKKPSLHTRNLLIIDHSKRVIVRS